MLKDATYDKIKLLYKLSCITWFIDKHATEDIKDQETIDLLKKMHEDLTSYSKKLKKIISKDICENEKGN